MRCIARSTTVSQIFIVKLASPRYVTLMDHQFAENFLNTSDDSTHPRREHVDIQVPFAGADLTGSGRQFSTRGPLAAARNLRICSSACKSCGRVSAAPLPLLPSPFSRGWRRQRWSWPSQPIWIGMRDVTIILIVYLPRPIRHCVPQSASCIS